MKKKIKNYFTLNLNSDMRKTTASAMQENHKDISAEGIQLHSDYKIPILNPQTTN